MQYYTEAARQQEDYSGVKQIGVDETSKAKGHDYVSLFVNFRFPDPLLKPNGTSAWRSDQFVYQSVAFFWMTEVYFIQLLQ